MRDFNAKNRKKYLWAGKELRIREHSRERSRGNGREPGTRS